MTRTALLIGVAQTPDAPGFEPLDAPVSADLAGLRNTLEASGYEVEVLADAGRAQIGTRIFEVARDVPEGGTFLVYFTGHGIRLDADYLVPADATAPPDGDWAQPYRDSLLLADISPYLTQCRAGTVLWLIDACRDEMADAAFGTRIVQGPPSGGFALIVGCDIGERCGYAADGSFFTQGLIDAFSSLTASQTVHEVYETARSVTARLARRHGRRQRVQIRYGTDQEEHTRTTKICEGRHLLEEWRAAVMDEGLWQLASPSDLVPRLQACLLPLVDDCVRLVQSAGQRLRDPWTDDDFAPRLLLRTLPKIIPVDVRLSAVEVATLIAAVFLHEGAWAERLSQAAEIEPKVEGRQPDAGAHRRHLEQVHDQHAHVARRLTDLLMKRRYEDCHDIALWLVHRWIAERLETDETPVPTAPATAFAHAVLADAGRAEELVDVLSRLASSIGADPPLDRAPDDLARKVRLPSGSCELRERPLAALLRMAGVLAVDVRVLPEVVAEHLGVSDAVLPKEIVTVVRDSVHWSTDGAGTHLDVSCPHQAMHAAFEEVADRADRLAAQARKLADELPESEAVLLAGIPGRVTASELRPRQSDGRKAYDVPLLRFRLAQTEVRDLLMAASSTAAPIWRSVSCTRTPWTRAGTAPCGGSTCTRRKGIPPTGREPSPSRRASTTEVGTSNARTTASVWVWSSWRIPLPAPAAGSSSPGSSGRNKRRGYATTRPYGFIPTAVSA